MRVSSVLFVKQWVHAKDCCTYKNKPKRVYSRRPNASSLTPTASNSCFCSFSQFFFHLVTALTHSHSHSPFLHYSALCGSLFVRILLHESWMCALWPALNSRSNAYECGCAIINDWILLLHLSLNLCEMYIWFERQFIYAQCAYDWTRNRIRINAANNSLHFDMVFRWNGLGRGNRQKCVAVLWLCTANMQIEAAEKVLSNAVEARVY